MKMLVANIFIRPPYGRVKSTAPHIDWSLLSYRLPAPKFTRLLRQFSTPGHGLRAMYICVKLPRLVSTLAFRVDPNFPHAYTAPNNVANHWWD